MRIAAPVVAGSPLRALEARDEALYCALYGDADTMRHVGPVLSAEEARAAFARVMARLGARPARAAYWLLPWRLGAGPDGAAAGLMAVQVQAAAGEVGVLLPPGAQGGGIASAGIAALADAVFSASPLQALWTRHARSHAAAAALMRGLGFQVAKEEVAGECRWQLTRAHWTGLRERAPPRMVPARGLTGPMEETR